MTIAPAEQPDESHPSRPPSRPPAPKRYDTPAPWSASDTVAAVAIYGGFGWVVGVLVVLCIVPAGPGTYLVSLAGAAACTIAWVRHVVRTQDGGSWATALGVRFLRRDLLIGPAVAAALYGVELAGSALLVWRLGPAAEDSAWGATAEVLHRPAMVAVAILGVTVAPFVEEVVFRGMLLRSLAGRFGVADRIAIASVIFGALHLSPTVSWQANLTTFILVSVFGAGMCVVSRWTDRLGPAIVAHSVTNLVAFSLLIADLPT